MDMNVFNGMVSVVIMALVFPSLGILWWWHKREGQDERGRLIAYKSTVAMTNTFVILFVVLTIADVTWDLAKSLYKLFVVSGLGISVFAGCLSILILRKKY
ncbi:hypothetical protein [Ammoniphilus sp. CFH 90114]|uniref:hypothetical protein n=1 Tax=Ammoniphilus sp. CFH 90114 TaxID=2493665 RepID=UPI00100DBC99|nr:hypothetical protein [Ammoniphilus sp. CFH 90114]RXT03911.1 hypothetical protein EIZ39_22375 [Ammoniphilus sp. CFH 90114]